MTENDKKTNKQIKQEIKKKYAQFHPEMIFILTKWQSEIVRKNVDHFWVRISKFREPYLPIWHEKKITLHS